ncbi:apoptosis antagonizing transcription factor-domain-containing protein [Hyaloraphidium curvatum]|nr:apoptosis antagonizing transcription factor-domain-containing protein [Hyaloraphidium curvatum]
MTSKAKGSLASFLKQITSDVRSTEFDPEAGSALDNGLLAKGKGKSVFTMLDEAGDAVNGGDAPGSDSDRDSMDEEAAIRKGYVSVGEGAIRKNLELDLGDERYVGRRVDRKSLMEGSGSESDGEEDSEQEPEEWSGQEGSEASAGEESSSGESGPDHDDEPVARRESAPLSRTETEYFEAEEGPAASDSEEDGGIDLRDLARKLVNGSSRKPKGEARDESDSEDLESEDESDTAADHRGRKGQRSSKAAGGDVNSELRRLEEEEKELMKRLSASARADVEKGQNVKAQLAIFESLLDLRIKLQPALTSANQLPPHDLLSSFVSATSSEPHPTPQDDLHEMRSELSHVITDLMNLRFHLLEQSPGFPADQLPSNRKRKSHPNQSLEDRWNDLDELERLFESYRDQTLDKWWAKAHGGAQSVATKFKAVNQAASAQVRNILADKERLRKRTRLWRSGDGRSLGRPDAKERNAAVSEEKAAVDAHLANLDTEIFDDTDFYSLLLKELIDSRGSSSSMDPMQMASNHLLLKQLQDRKKKATKKQVDTRASKGRKIRYHVMDKLRNFMAPREVADMEDGLKNELFANLFGGLAKHQQATVAVAPKAAVPADPAFKLFG